MSRLDTILVRDANSWRRAASCRGKDPRIFFEPHLKPLARRACAACPVRDACLEEAIADERDGFWGGTDDHERQNIIDRRRFAGPKRGRKAPAARGELYDTLVALSEHPHRWARIATYPSPNSGPALASLLRNGYKPSPPGRWTFEGRVNEAGGSDLYARFDGASA